MRGPVLIDGFAGALHRTAERKCGFADNRIAGRTVKNGHLVPVSQQSLPALVVQNYHIVGICLNIVSHHLRTTFTESLHNFSGLWTRSAVYLTAKSSAGPSTVAAHFPRLAICDENAGFLLPGGRVLFVLSNCYRGQQG